MFRDADLVLCLDTRDWERPTTELVSTTREVTSVVPAGAKWIDIGFGDLELSSWALDYQRLQHADLRILADTTLAIPALTQLLEARIASDATLAATREGAHGRHGREERRAATRSGPTRRRRTGTRARSRCRGSPRRSGTRSRQRGLGAHRRHARALDAQALGLRQALPASGPVARHGDAVRHLASAWRSRTATRSGWSWTCSPTAT